ncbi:MAG TPA: PaaX family transcriptional regulator C-terminal domain-containing protein [Streptosporangiaceae bacterium]
MTAAANAHDLAEGGGQARGARPGNLIVTIYGLYAQHGGWISVAALVDLLGDLGVDEPAVRSSVSRLKRRGILRSARQDGAAGYAVSDDGRAILREGDQRIFARQRADVGDGWVLAVFSVPEAERHKRHLLRSQLTRLGYGTAAPGVWIAPAHLRDVTIDTLSRLGLDGYADLFAADHIAFGDLPTLVRRWWDLDELHRNYQEFLDAHGPSARRHDGRTPDGPAAFADYVRLVTDWRRLPYLDPGLPAALLPDDWIGIRAADLFFALHTGLEGAARAHVRRVTESVSGGRR